MIKIGGGKLVSNDDFFFLRNYEGDIAMWTKVIKWNKLLYGLGSSRQLWSRSGIARHVDKW